MTRFNAKPKKGPTGHAPKPRPSPLPKAPVKKAAAKSGPRSSGKR